MKIHPTLRQPGRTRSAAAFTLIELLVVITIIGLLASLTFVGVQNAFLAAKKVQARHDMQEIISAVNFYYSEYNRYPASQKNASTMEDVYYGAGGSDNKEIVNILRCTNTWAEEEDSKATVPQNPRRIKYLEPKLVGMAKGGVYASYTTSAGDQNWYDPWGRQYIIFIDGDYNTDITVGQVLPDLSMEKIPISCGAACVGYYANTTTGASGASVFSFKSADVKKKVLLSWQ